MRVSLFAVAAIALASGTAPLAAQSAALYGPAVTKAVDSLRNATRRFQSLDTAAAAGYTRDVADCLVHEHQGDHQGEHQGAMGYHHGNRALNDAKIETQRPEILLYERLPDSSYRLNGVEYIVPYRAWPRDSIPPIALGQTMRHEDNLQLWYLHVWAWTANPDGIFADFNPVVRCPASASKVFTPFARP